MHKQPKGLAPEIADAIFNLKTKLEAHHARAEKLRALVETALIAGIFDLAYDPHRVSDADANRAGRMIDLFIDLAGGLADEADQLVELCLLRGEFGTVGGATDEDGMREAA